MDSLYTFVYRGLLTEESLDKAGRRTRATIGQEELDQLRHALSFDMLDEDRIASARKMAIVYSGVHAFENTVRDFVSSAMAEAHAEEWWEKVPNRIQTKVSKRIEEEAKFRWHGGRGGAEIDYCDFGDLSSIIASNWDIFEDILVDLEWVKATLSILERSRNIVMHGGMLERQDIERIGMNVRDWIRQAG